MVRKTSLLATWCWLNYNLWSQNSGSGWQCVWNSYQFGQTVGWGTNGSWTGQQNFIVAYDLWPHTILNPGWPNNPTHPQDFLSGETPT